MVISCAPQRVFTALVAQRPKAAEPPALFIRSTMMPSITRKIRMEMSMALIMPTPSPAPTKFTTICQGWKFASSRAPARQPRNREEYTSLLIRARAMATTGGNRAQPVATKPLPSLVTFAMTSAITTIASAIKYAILVPFFSIRVIYLLRFGAFILLANSTFCQVLSDTFHYFNKL